MLCSLLPVGVGIAHARSQPMRPPGCKVGAAMAHSVGLPTFTKKNENEYGKD